MPIEIKSTQELERMRHAGRVVSEILQTVHGLVRPGVKTSELNDAAEQVLKRHNSFSPFKDYPNARPREPRFPSSICVSINNEIVHGIPRSGRTLKVGDIISVDVGASMEGFFADAAWTFAVEPVDPKARHLLDVTERALVAGIAQTQPGNHLWDLIQAVQQVVESEGLTLVREYQGHGVGRQLHEEPSIPNFLDQDFRRRPPNVRLQPGMTLAIEPMVVTGDWRTRTLSDKWTVVTRDGGWAAHFEHTVAVTPSGPEVLTKANGASG